LCAIKVISASQGIKTAVKTICRRGDRGIGRCKMNYKICPIFTIAVTAQYWPKAVIDVLAGRLEINKLDIQSCPCVDSCAWRVGSGCALAMSKQEAYQSGLTDAKADGSGLE